MAEITPMMRQYTRIKEEHPDCLLFFRLGDFYEMFYDDAKLGAEELGLTLTTRDRGKPKEDRTPMCGVPYHSVEGYIARLIAKGYKIAICEQMEDPAQAKGLVDRDVVRIVTPGTAMGETMLDESVSNYICAIYQDESGAAMARCEMSTGQFVTIPFQGDSWLSHMSNRLSACPPSEVILCPAAMANEPLMNFLHGRIGCLCEDGGETRFQLPEAMDALAACGLREKETAPKDDDSRLRLGYRAAGALAAYLTETQKTNLNHLGPLSVEDGNNLGYMELDISARRNLELTETLRGKEKKGSLLWVLDKTKTAMGHRLIRSWLEQPLRLPSAIHLRQEAVAALLEQSVAREELTHTLREIPDLERLIGKVSFGSANARDMKLLAQGLAALPGLAQKTKAVGSQALDSLTGFSSGTEELRAAIDAAIRDEDEANRLPPTIREGGFIRPGFNKELDRLRNIVDHGGEMVLAMESRERERTGIKNLKIRYNKVFGYFIEISKANLNLAPKDYMRKQTLVNSERFITQELKDLEHDILSAQTRITAMEYTLFCQLRDKVAEQARMVQDAARAVAQLDTLLSFATVAAENHYCRPEVDNGNAIEIIAGRHPVVEQMQKDGLFVPNDFKMDGGTERVAIITGPNMAGKSTYMRQVALIVLMAQMGSFVPARTAHIGVVDRVFTRIGASDDLASGQSTFMVEMCEVSELLKNATKKSLIILDEIGRGTSTYDGMSIARAVLEYCADQKRLGAKTLFATHYHELTEVEGEIQGVKNFHIAAKKRGDEVIFLRKIVPGGADQSFGIEVAKLAGVPEPVIRRAKEILEQLERQTPIAAPTRAAPEEAEREQPRPQSDAGAEVLETLKNTSVETITAIEALNLLYNLKKKLEG